MGLESFYISVKPCPKMVLNDKNDLVLTNFVNELMSLGVRVKARNSNEFCLNEFIIMNVQTEQDIVVKFSLEGCFSWYKECVEEIQHIILRINESIVVLNVVWPEPEKVVSSIDSFFDHINSYYCDKYDGFVSMFGSMDCKLLTKEDFYSYIEKKRRPRGLFNKLKLFRKKM